jgi:hypothetical protein
MTKRPRSMIRETVDRISAVHSCESSNFMELFRLSGLPYDEFKGEVMEGWDLSYSDLRSLDLTGTTFVNCNTTGTIFPESFKNEKMFYDEVKGEVMESWDLFYSDLPSLALIETTFVNRNTTGTIFPEGFKNKIIFTEACKNGDKGGAIRLIDEGVRFNIKDDWEYITLIKINNHGSESIVRLSLKGNAGRNPQNDGGDTWLINQYEDMLHLLLKNRGDIHIQYNKVNTALDNKVNTALIRVNQYDHKSTIRSLLKNGKSINMLVDAVDTDLIKARRLASRDKYFILRLIIKTLRIAILEIKRKTKDL